MLVSWQTRRKHSRLWQEMAPQRNIKPIETPCPPHGDYTLGETKRQYYPVAVAGAPRDRGKGTRRYVRPHLRAFPPGRDRMRSCQAALLRRCQLETATLSHQAPEGTRQIM